MGAARQLWDATKHPRGPGGKFASVGGGAKKTARDAFASTDHAALHKHTVPQLREQAKTAGLKGHSRSRKAELVDALVAHKAPGPARSAREKMTARPAAKTVLPKKSAPLTKQAALDAAPVKLGPYGFERGSGDPDALSFYRGHGYIEVNAQLRDGRALSTDRKADWAVKAIDDVMARSKLTRDIQVHRGVGDLRMFGPDAPGKKSLVGMEFRDAAYASATADPNVAKEFFAAEGGGGVLHIRVPAGTGAVQLSDLGPKPRHHWEYPRPPEHEAELLLQRGLTYRVVGDRTVNGARELDVEVVPA